MVVSSQPVYHNFFTAEVTCYHCQHQLGVVKRELGVPNSPLLYRPIGAAEFRRLQRISELRCTRCGGPIYLDEAQTVREVEEPGLFEDVRPRKGRPIKLPPHMRRAS